MHALLIALSLHLAAAPPPPPASEPAGGDELTFAAEGSSGGKCVALPDGTRGVTVDRSCELPWPQVTRIAWKSAAPMPAGWWQGSVELGKRAQEDLGWAQLCFGVALLSPDAPLVSLMDHFRLPEGPAQYSAPGPFRFEFWIYSAFPAEGVAVRPVYSDIWKYKRQWPVTRVTMRPVRAPSLGADSPVALDVAVRPDGAVDLPEGLPAGLWQLAFHAKCSGEASLVAADGRAVRAPFETRYAGTGWSGGAFAWLASPLRKVALHGAACPRAFTLNNCRIRPPAQPLPSRYGLATTADPARAETARLELAGRGLAAGAPALPLLPMGKKVAVVTSWDDGPEADLRLAEVLGRLGLRATFFLNQNNPGMKTLGKLEALGHEIGSHCYTHCFLFQLMPQQALHECAAMRELLEKTLAHPVISFSYPNGYSPAYDTGGDFVLRAVKAAGYWSGRTTAVQSQTVDTIAEPAALATDGFFGEDQRGVLRQWETARARPGAIFHVWGHAWQLGKTDEQWSKVEQNLAKLAHHPDAWYATQGQVAIWCWLRKNVQIEASEKRADRLVLTVRRPWLHPYLAAQRPLSLEIPAGVESVRWQNKEVPIAQGFIELDWPAPPSSGGESKP